MRSLIKINIKHKVMAFLALTLAIFLPAIYVLWVFLHWAVLLVVAFLALGVIIYLATHKNISIPYVAPVLTRYYFKSKFTITDLENSLNKEDKLGRILKLFLYSSFLKLLYFLILLFKNSQESFLEIREEIQKKYREVSVTDSHYGVVFNFQRMHDKIESGENIDVDVLVEYYQKLFDLHKKQQKKAARYSIGTLGLLILATIISGTVTSLIFNKTQNIFAATYYFAQSSWAGGASETAATHASDRSGWIYYSTTTVGIAAGADISISSSSFWFADDGAVSTSTPGGYATGGGFDNGANASTTVSGSGAGASVILSGGGPYVASGTFESATIDTGGGSDFSTFTPATTQSASTSIKIQVAANNNSTWDYKDLDVEDYPDGVTVNTSRIRQDCTGYNLGVDCFTTLASWEAARDGNLVALNAIEVARIEGFWSSADTAPVDINDWTTGPNNYIRIYTEPEARHNGKWDTSKYRLETMESTALAVHDDYVRIDGLQVTASTTATTTTSGVSFSWINDASDNRLSNTIIKGTGQYSVGIGASNQTAGNLKINNCIVYGATNQYFGGLRYGGTQTLYVYNSTFVNNYYGIAATPEPGGSVIAKNNIAKGNSSSNYTGTFAAGTDYNASASASIPDVGSNNLANRTFAFVSETEGEEDYRLAAGDAGAKNLGTDLSADANYPFAYDIMGHSRAGEVWDIGAHEYGSTSYNIPSSLDGKRYFRYKVFLLTNDTAYTPTLDSLTLNYIQYYLSANLVSSIYNTEDDANLITAISWTETGTTTNETVKFQIRSSPDGSNWSEWCGYSEASTSTCAGTNYFTYASNGAAMADTNPLLSGANDRYFQYKVILASAGTTTPAVDDIQITYVVNAPPEVQNFIATQGSDGYVNISYEVKDVDSDSGTITPGYVTPSFEYWDGDSWAAATTFSGGDLDNKAVSTSSFTGYSAIWNAAADFSDQFMGSTFAMRITINDNEAANNTVQLVSASTTLDTTAPNLGAVPIKVIATSTPANVILSATDDSDLYIKISQNPALSDVDWAPYESATTTVLATDPDTVYVQFKDAYGNTTASSSATTPETPSALMIQDVSNVSTGEYSLFFAWKEIETPNPGFDSYLIFRSDDGGSAYINIGSTTIKAENYYRDTDISSSTTYYYKVVARDANGNVSYYPSAVNGIANGIQDGGEGGGGSDVTAPAISDVQVIATTTQTATIVWDTDELSNSTVGYSTTPGSYATEVGSATMADTAAGVGRHQVVLTNLSASTTYYFQVKSTDPSGNTGINSGVGGGMYSFVTKPGAIISNTITSEIQNNNAIILWTTDIAADSEVIYSLNSDLSDPQTMQGSPSLVTSHSVTLTGLDENTRYYYYVKSTDGESNIATDDNSGEYYTFLTTQDTAEPIITFNPASDITNISTSTAIISWVTDQAATSTIAYGTTSGGPYDNRSDINNYNYNHSVNLTGLTASTTYYFQLVATDENGNSTTTNNGGAGFSFTTLELSDDTAPEISSVGTSTTINSATITWSTDENASSFVQYATSTANFESDYIEKGRSATTTSHSVMLTDLSENITYYFRVRSADIDGNAATDDNSGNYYSFTTARDETAPVISSISASPVTDSSAVITWTTSERATSQITFGTETGTYSSSTAINTNLNLTHSLTLSGLAAGTTYYYRVVSTDASNNTATSTEQSLSTSESLVTESQAQAREAAARANVSGGGILIIDKNDKTAPIITNVKVQEIKSDSAIVTWNTDEEANSLVKYNSGEQEFSQFDPESLNKPSLAHTVKLAQLMPESVYTLHVISMDKSGNLTQSDAQTFKTLSLVEEIDKKAEQEDSEEEKENILLSTVTKTIELMNRIASQVSLSTMQTALMAQFNSIEDLANLVPAPIMSGEPKVELTPTAATIAWRTDKESNSLVAIVKEAEYDSNKAEPYAQIVGLPEDRVLDHLVIVSDLEPDTVYHYQLRSKGAIGSRAESADFIFRTPKRELEISNYSVDNITPQKAVFKWATNAETNSQIKYIPYRNNMLAVDEARMISDKAFTTIHEITISEFEAGTVYQVEISGKDAEGSIASRIIPTFFTSDVDLPPTISQIQTNLAISPGNDSKIQAVISWLTDEPATSRVFYQKGFIASGTPFAEKTFFDSNYTKRHAVVITKFEPGAVYTFKVESVDSGGNTVLSKTHTILAPTQKETVFQIIMKNFEAMFSWIGNVNGK